MSDLHFYDILSELLCMRNALDVEKDTVHVHVCCYRSLSGHFCACSGHVNQLFMTIQFKFQGLFVPQPLLR